MKNELTREILNLRQGDHACLLYNEDPAEQMLALVPYIKQGLEEGEQCIYIADDLTVEDVARTLESGGIDVQRESERGALRLWTRSEWRQPGELDSAKKSLQVRGFIDEALKAGFKGVRFAVEMTWILGPDISVDKLKHWEATINTLFVPGVPGRIVCQYSRHRLSASVLQAGLSTHPIAILDDLCANFFYEAPAILENKSETEKLDWMVSQLKKVRVAEQQREEAIRQEAQALLVAIVESSDDAIISKTLDGIITSWNRGADRLFGYAPQEAIGQPITIIVPPERHDEERSILERLRRGERIDHYETVRASKDGRLIDVSITISPIRDRRGRIIGASKVARDITAQKEAEEKLRRQAEELEQQLIASGRLVSLGQITASMAHEFNNPLGIIMGFTQDLLGETKPSSSNYQALKIIDEEAKRCQKIIRDLLDYARPKSADFCRTDIRQLVEKTISLVANHLYKQKIDSATQIEDNIPSLYADPQQLEQVLVNLYLNAIDAMPEGGKLTVGAALTPSVEGEGKRDGDGKVKGVTIWVTDTGFGIQETDLPRIFQPFFTAKKKRGLGLGLPVCDRIVKNHGGRIEVESRPEQGTTFKIYLPLPEAPSEKRNDQDPVGEPKTQNVVN
ncbi:MAG TPA: MEDS domain-containing protein [Candidatus Binatia bacterium]|nr:MEDS domain-containing protein [Candidatus Binatia bacterium]